MNVLKPLSGSTLALLACMAAGALCGLVAEPAGALAYLFGQLYLAVVNMAAMPLLVVATFFGLRQVCELPRPAWRVGTIGALALGLMVLCGVAGTLAGALAMPGAHLPEHAYATFGERLLQSAGDAQEVGVTLFDGADAAVSQTSAYGWREAVPDNFYRVLAQGHPLGILAGTLLFGLAFAALSREQTSMLGNVFEGVYRTLEIIIERANLLIPVLAFGTAAWVSAHTPPAMLAAMGSFLVCFLACAAVLGGAATALTARRAGLPLVQIVASLKAPLLVGLTSGSATASIPHTIEAMSARLGFSRGIVELIVPFGAVFVRAGSALYFSLATVFVANLYDRPLGTGDFAVIAFASVGAAFLSSGKSGVATVGYMGVVLSLLQLPAEAASVLFVTIDLICEGPRNVVSLLAVCAVIALVSAGLPSERVMPEPLRAQPPVRAPLHFALSRGQLALVAGCAMTVASLIVLMGIGVGAK